MRHMSLVGIVMVCRIELNVEKKHGKGSDLVRDKKLFIKACREYAQSQVDKQRNDFIRLGVLG
jgi:isoleucyl-tRNA synthetase